jgi:hypothetical protein
LKEFLNELALTPEGKKSIVCIFNSIRSPHVKPEYICNFLDFIKNNDSYSGILCKNDFRHNGQIIHVMPISRFLKRYVDANSSFFGDDLSILDEKTMEYYLSIIPKESYKYGDAEFKTGQPFFWVTNEADHDPLKLGLNTPNDHFLKVTFPNKTYVLYRPTIIEGNGYDWFYSNPDIGDSWGKTINIGKLTPDCLENDMTGAPEALHAPVVFAEEHEVSYLCKVNEDEKYFKSKLSILYSNVENNFYNDDMIDEIVKIYNTKGDKND